MARCVIVSACPVSPALAGLLRAEDYLIACDAGYCNCKALGRQPDAVVGDFDSAPRPQTRPGEALVVLPHVKDDTDTQYAARLAVQRGCTEALLLGCLGGPRLEHTLANLCTGLGLEQQGVAAVRKSALRCLDEVQAALAFAKPGFLRCFDKFVNPGDEPAVPVAVRHQNVIPILGDDPVPCRDLHLQIFLGGFLPVPVFIFLAFKCSLHPYFLAFFRAVPLSVCEYYRHFRDIARPCGIIIYTKMSTGICVHYGADKTGRSKRPVSQPLASAGLFYFPSIRQVAPSTL